MGIRSESPRRKNLPAHPSNPSDPTGIILRLDSGTGLPPLPKGFTVESQICRSPKLIVDAVVNHPSLRSIFDRREKAYRTAGWIPLDAELGGYPRLGSLGLVPPTRSLGSHSFGSDSAGGVMRVTR